MSFSALEKKLNYSFLSDKLIRQALTHRSFGPENNERLEFLGDSLLNCIVAEFLFQRFASLPEGDLSRIRANLVRQDSLHQIALELGLGDLLNLGEGELRSGGHQRPSILADTVEAIFGAIFLESGFACVRAVIQHLYRKQLEAINIDKPQKDPKTRLQEWLQGKRKSLPRYRVLSATGAAHEQRFEVVCELDNPAIRTTGMGSSRRLAEQAAAENALKVIQA